MIQHALMMIRQENDEVRKGSCVRQKGTGVWKPVGKSEAEQEKFWMMRLEKKKNPDNE